MGFWAKSLRIFKSLCDNITQSGPAGAIKQKVTVSPWKKPVVLLHDMYGIKVLTFLH